MSLKGWTALLCCLAAAAVLLHPETALAAAAPVSSASPFDRVVIWIFEQQRAFHRELAEGLRRLTAGGGWTAALGLIASSFAYGVFHAAGPGHGKAVLTTYLLTHRERIARGVWLAAAAALCQGLSAVALVVGLTALAGWLPRETQAAVIWSERLSYALVCGVGAMLAWRSLPGLAAALRATIAASRPIAVAAGAAGPVHDHAHDGHACGHGHTVDTADHDRATDLRTTLGLILSIGLRPCSGAILVLAFANLAGLLWAGIAAVGAMSAGTALAIASLAFLAVAFRGWAARIAGHGPGRLFAWSGLVMLAGGLLVTAIGLSLLAGSFAPAHPLGLT